MCRSAVPIVVAWRWIDDITAIVQRDEQPVSIRTILAGKSAHMPPQQQLAVGQGIILVVDDEPAVCEMAARMLTRLGLTVLTACMGDEAIETFRAHAADISCVLLDLVMPGMSGEQVFYELRRIQPALPIVVMSGLGEVELAQRFMGQPFVRLLAKPFMLMELQEAIQ
jgi:two-component system, cell cycle sensor histidine kinase and response regulator CckA